MKDFIKRHFRHFNAAVVVEASEAYVDHLDKGGKMFMTLAGAMSTAELGISLAEMIRQDKVHGICSTGANLEEYEFENVFYWKEFTGFLDWAKENITSTIFSCWAVHAGLYHHYGVRPRTYEKKQFGIFPHRVRHEPGSPFLASMDDEILVPHSRWKGIEQSDIDAHKELETLIESEGAGPHLIVGHQGRELYLQGHPEYDRGDIAEEYLRDKAKGIAINSPQHYFPGNDETKTPLRNWSANGQVFYSNWINWVYQTTNVDVKKPLMDA